MIKTRLLALCGSLLIGGLALAQAPSTPPTPPTPAQMAAHQVSFLTQMLTLTSEQQSRATAIFTTESTTESGLRESMQTAHKALQTAIDANNASGITTAAEEIGQLTAQEVEGHATAQAALEQILTADQLGKYKTLHQHGPGFGPGGPGGHGGHGGPDGPPPTGD